MPLRIDLSSNNFTILNEDIFSLFLNLHKNSKIDFKKNLLNCSHCQNAWILNTSRNLERQILNARCSDGKPLFDNNPLINCPKCLSQQELKQIFNDPIFYFQIVSNFLLYIF